MRGFKFHNGQIVGDLETRPTDKDDVKDYYGDFTRDSSDSRLYRVEFPPRHSADDGKEDDSDTDPLRLYDLVSRRRGWEINVSIQPAPKLTINTTCRRCILRQSNGFAGHIRAESQDRVR